jgi:hypothetical protein
MANGQTFEPKTRYSSPTIESSITLNTEQAKRIFKRCFEGAGRSLFTIDVVTRALAEGNKAFNHGEVMGAINTMLTSLEKEIVDSTARYEVLLEKNNHSNTSARYTNAEQFTFSISTPEILRFATILSAFDQMMVKFDTCWLVRLVDSKQAQTYRSDKLRMIMKLVRRLQLQATSARRAARRTGTPDMLEQIGDLSSANEHDASAMDETQEVREANEANEENEELVA